MFEQPFDSVFDKFKGTDSNAWKEKVIADLKEKSFEDLISLSEDNIEILPFYTFETTQQYKLNIPSKKTQHWQIVECVAVDHVEAANAEALLALEKGATAILFDLKQQVVNETEIKLLIKDFLIEAITIYAENIGDSSIYLLQQYGIICYPKIFVPQQKSTVNELLFAVHHLFKNDEQIYKIHFNTGQNFFLEIAKLRAFKWLIAQINQIQQTNKGYILFSETGFEKRNDDFVENNILRNTTEAMSAILGGCDALIIHPHEQSNLGKRIARNIHHLLYFESNFKQIPNVVDGTYYIEYLTYQLAQKTWQQLG